MAEPTAPRAATKPFAIISPDRVGYSVQLWQAPSDGWTATGDAKRAASLEDANAIALQLIVEHGGTLAVLLDPRGPLKFPRGAR